MSDLTKEEDTLRPARRRSTTHAGARLRRQSRGRLSHADTARPARRPRCCSRCGLDEVEVDRDLPGLIAVSTLASDKQEYLSAPTWGDASTATRGNS